MKQFLKNTLQKFNAKWVEITTLAIAIAGIVLVSIQLWQANKHKRWDNYNAMNAAYHQLYNGLYDGTHTGILQPCAQLQNLSLKELAWIRAYFDLYAEEHWLEIEGLIPKGMWKDQIDGGVDLNLSRHPVMVDGYLYWLSQGAFRHPSGFSKHMKDKIQKLSLNIETITNDKCNIQKTSPESDENFEEN